MTNLLILYDITNNKLRRKIEKTLRDYGVRLQYSVFECRLDANLRSELREKLTDITETHRKLVKENDSIIVIDGLSQKNFTFLLKKACVSNNYVIY
jgi:CRISPR-associated endonuclease Cas2